MNPRMTENHHHNSYALINRFLQYNRDINDIIKYSDYIVIL